MSAAFTPAERRLLRVLVAATVVGTCWHTCRDLSVPPPPVEVLRGALRPDSTGASSLHGGAGPDVFPLDLACADSAALTALPGVGPVLAGRIASWRRARGGITDPEELLEVSGIGRAGPDPAPGEGGPGTVRRCAGQRRDGASGARGMALTLPGVVTMIPRGRAGGRSSGSVPCKTGASRQQEVITQ